MDVLQSRVPSPEDGHDARRYGEHLCLLIRTFARSQPAENLGGEGG